MIFEEKNQGDDIYTYIEDGAKKYKIAKFEYGSIPGYRLTDLTFAGDLIANVGETIVSVLDKIKNMLGDFEYFYNHNKRNYRSKKKALDSLEFSSHYSYYLEHQLRVYIVVFEVEFVPLRIC